MFTSAGGENEVQPIVTNEREKGEKVHMRDGKAEEHLRVCAGSAQLAVTNDRHGKSFGRAFCESALNVKVEYLFSPIETKHFWNFFLRFCAV